MASLKTLTIILTDTHTTVVLRDVLCACVPADKTKMTSSRTRTGVCGCKGARACLLCEGEAAREAEAARPSLYLCHNCGELRSAKDCREDPAHPPLRACISPTAVLRGPWPTLLQFEGVTVVKEFITSPEEAAILSAIDSKPWVYSQSGRRKQVNQTSKYFGVCNMFFCRIMGQR